jgi:plasmid stabilization system protein ParE
MQLRSTERAAADLDGIAVYLFEQTPAHAGRIVLEIYNAPEMLTSFPLRGRTGPSQELENLLFHHFLLFLLFLLF